MHLMPLIEGNGSRAGMRSIEGVISCDGGRAAEAVFCDCWP